MKVVKFCRTILSLYLLLQARSSMHAAPAKLKSMIVQRDPPILDEIGQWD